MGKTKYILVIDGQFHGFYDSWERAKKECYCGDKFRIYEAVLIEEINRKPTVEGE
jgi:hypothetical protein